MIGGNAVMGGRAADWFLDLIFGANDRARARHFAAMDAAAARVPAGSGGVRFLPFLSGQVAPESRPGASAVFTGLRTSHDRNNAYRAVLEGGAFAIRSIFDQIHAWCGDPAVIRLTGSGARSPIWCDILANTIGRPLEASDEAVEGRGAAIFASVALGMYPDYDAAARALVPVKHRYEPDDALASPVRKPLPGLAGRRRRDAAARPAAGELRAIASARRPARRYRGTAPPTDSAGRARRSNTQPDCPSRDSQPASRRRPA